MSWPDDKIPRAAFHKTGQTIRPCAAVWALHRCILRGVHNSVTRESEEIWIQCYNANLEQFKEMTYANAFVKRKFMGYVFMANDIIKSRVIAPSDEWYARFTAQGVTAARVMIALSPCESNVDPRTLTMVDTRNITDKPKPFCPLATYGIIKESPRKKPPFPKNNEITI
jgi:hypothetical protein